MDGLTLPPAEVGTVLADLATLGVQVSIDGDDLALRGPRGAIDASLRARLVACKPAILALLRNRAEPAAAAPDLAARHLPFPLTDIQEAYWIGRTDLAEHGSVMCHYYQEFEREDLDLDRLERAFRQVIARHDMLRAVVDPDGRQRILAEVPPFAFGRDDLRDRSDADAAGRIAAIREHMAYSVFDAAKWPLYEVHAVLVPSGRLRLHISFDLIMIDAESLSTIIWEWKRFYDRPETDAAPLAFGFRDYALHRRADRASDSYRRSLAYWDARLDDLPPAPALPRDNAPGAMLRSRLRRTVPRAVWAGVTSRLATRGLTGSALLCAVFADVLATWSREPRLTINLTFCDRQPLCPDVAALIGDFTTNILLACDTTPEGFHARATAVQAQLRRDLDHTQVSGVEVLRRLNRRRHHRSLVTMPVVFTSLLGHRADGPNVLFSSNWLGELVYGISQTPQVSLDFQAYEEQGGLLLQWDAVQADYPDGVIEAMFDAYGRALERLGQDNDAWESAVLVRLPEEQAATRRAVNATAEPTEDTLLQTLFDRQRAIRPHDPAVIAADRRLDYCTLDREALIFAHALVDLGARTGQHVAVVMHKGWEQVVAVLAILRAGAAYLPIDPDVPPARLHRLLQNAEANLVLTQPRLANGLEWPEGLTILSVEPAAPGLADPPPLAARQGPDAAAYTIFTSGSTGAPKGVTIQHRAVINTILDINRRFGIGASDRVLALSALNFDLSVYDIFGLLAAGGVIVVPPPGAERDPEDWAARIETHRVTVWNTVPQLMQMLVEHRNAERTIEGMRVVMLSGDWIPPALPARIAALLPGAAIWSLGGATEASIWSILHPIDGPTDQLRSIPYGRPMANQSIHVLDPRLQPRPDWTEGELFIGGIGLAAGYWRNPSETHHRFVTQPETGERLYRTGDLGRVLPGGTVELLGRIDFQVKIGGRRIELGEIEHALRRQDGVREAVVEACADPSGDRRLVAYVVLQHEGLQAADLLLALSHELPAYMVPALCLALPALPLSGNGKLDRKALPPPEWSRLADECPRTADTPVQIALLQAVRDVLGVNRVRLEDNVFELGGNSVQMVQINRRLRDALGRSLPVAEMFGHATLASYARHLQAGDVTPSPAAEAERGADRRAAMARRSRSRA